jgi:hypothetical protein
MQASTTATIIKIPGDDTRLLLFKLVIKLQVFICDLLLMIAVVGPVAAAAAE